MCPLSPHLYPRLLSLMSLSSPLSVSASSLFPSVTQSPLLPKLLASLHLQIATQMEFPLPFPTGDFVSMCPCPLPSLCRLALHYCCVLSPSPPPTPAISGFEVCLQESSRDNLFLPCLVRNCRRSGLRLASGLIFSIPLTASLALAQSRAFF